MKINWLLAVFLSAFLLSGCGTFSGSTAIPLSQHEIDKMMGNALELSSAPNIGAYAAQNPNVRIYKLAFDGTENDRDNVPKGERRTVVAHVADITKANYYPGPGTGWKGMSWLDSMFGYSSRQKAEIAKRELIEQTNKWLEDDPNTEVIVFVTGFSRGAAIARHFMNIVEQNWISDLTRYGKHSLSGPRFYALLFDTVATGQSNRLVLSVPKSLDYLVHFVAEDEMRSTLFTPIVDIDSNGNSYDYFMYMDGTPHRINTVMLPGSHSDTGASYSKGIGDIYLVLVEQLLNKLGLNQTNCWDIKNESFEAGKHDSRGLLDRSTGRPQANTKGGLRRDVRSLESAILDRHEFTEVSNRLLKISRGNALRALTFNGMVHPVFVVTREGPALRISVSANSIAESAIFVRSLGIPRIEYVSFGRILSITIPDEVFTMLPEGTPVTLSTSVLRTATVFEIVYFIDNVKILSLPINNSENVEVSNVSHSCAVDSNGLRTAPKAMIIRPTTNGFDVIPMN